MKTNEQAVERVNGGGRGDRDREGEGMKGRATWGRKGGYCVSVRLQGYERKEMECGCQVREFLSAASGRSLRRTGTQTGLLLAAGEALAAACLAARETYMWVSVWVCELLGPALVCQKKNPQKTQ